MTSDIFITGLNVHTGRDVALQRLYAFKKVGVLIGDGRIKRIVSLSEKIKNSEILKFPSRFYLVPGFIDSHIHGANGHDVMDGMTEALSGISSYLSKEGVTSFLATTMTESKNKIKEALLCVKEFKKNNNSIGGAELLGVHLEGPFISKDKKGAQNEKYIIPPSVSLFKQWQKISGGAIKIVTFAPELKNGSRLARYLSKNGVIAAMGHTSVDYNTACDAVNCGCYYVTHLFNAMPPLLHREPGLLTEALLDDRVMVEIIADGIHIHPEVIKFAYKLKGASGIVLVTDSMRAKGLKDGRYDLGGQEVIVKNGAARLINGKLAGSVLKMSNAVKNIMFFAGCGLSEAVKMASENPAKKLGVFNRKGSIEKGKDADLVVLDDKFNVIMTMCRGKIVNVRGDASNI